MIEADDESSKIIPVLGKYRSNFSTFSQILSLPSTKALIYWNQKWKN